jgi:hypothetical protein
VLYYTSEGCGARDSSPRRAKEMAIKWISAVAILLLLTVSCAGIHGQSDPEEVTVVAGTISEGVLVDDQGTKYILGDTEAGRDALVHPGERMLVTGRLIGKRGSQTIEVTAYQLWKQSGGSIKEEDPD